MSKFKINGYGLEVIDHQLNSKLGYELETAFTQLRDFNIVTDKNFNEINLSKIVKDCTGLKINFILEYGANAYVIPPDLNRNHVLYNNLRKNYFKSVDSNKIIKDKDFFEGSIDLATGIVTGDYCNVSSDLAIGAELLKKHSKYTVKETTAICLHEIGHIISYLKLVARMLKTNYLLDDAVSNLLKSETKEQRTVILTEIEKSTKTTIDKKDDIAEKARTKEAYAVLILNQSIKQSQQEFKVNIYDARSWEQLADQFASRHGYGKDIVTGLNKLYGDMGHHQYRSRITHFFMEIIKLLLFFMLGPVNWLIILLMIGNPLVEEYDPPRERFIKVKHQINDALKNPNLTTDQKARYLDDYNEIEKVINQLNDNVTAYEFIWGSLFPWGRAQRKSIKESQNIEGMLNSDLWAISTLLSL